MLAHATRAGSGAWNRGSIRTVPVNQSAGPFVEGCDPDFFISMSFPQLLNSQLIRFLATRHMSLATAVGCEPLLLISISQFPQLSAASWKMRPAEFWAMHAAIAAGGGLLVVLFGRRLSRALHSARRVDELSP